MPSLHHQSFTESRHRRELVESQPQDFQILLAATPPQSFIQTLLQPPSAGGCFCIYTFIDRLLAIFLLYFRYFFSQPSH